MKLYLRNKENFSKEAQDFYEKNFKLVSEDNADIIVINDFEAIKTSKVVACNSTGIEHIETPKDIISLKSLSWKGENRKELEDLTAVPELCLGMAIVIMRSKKEELRGKVLGLIGGHGRIGTKFAEYAKMLGVEFLVYDTFEDGEFGQDDEKLKHLLNNSDIVSLHISADLHNKNFMNKRLFERMKDGAIFLNSARPWLVEEEGFKWALDNKLYGAWSDFELDFDHPNLAITPHLGGTTKESKIKSEMIIARELLKRKNHG